MIRGQVQGGLSRRHHGHAACRQVDGGAVASHRHFARRAARRAGDDNIAAHFGVTRPDQKDADGETVIGGQVQGGLSRCHRGHAAGLQVDGRTITGHRHLARRAVRGAGDDDIAARFRFTRFDRNDARCEAVIRGQDQNAQPRRHRRHAAGRQVDGSAVSGDAHRAVRAARRTRNLDVARILRGTRRNRVVTDRKTVIGGQVQGGLRRHDHRHAARRQIDGGAVRRDPHRAGRAARRTRNLDVARSLGSPRGNREVAGREAVIRGQIQDGSRRHDRGHAARFQIDGGTVSGDAHRAGRAARRTRNLDVAQFLGGAGGHREVTGREAVVHGQLQGGLGRHDRRHAACLQVNGATVAADRQLARRAARGAGDHDIASRHGITRCDRNDAGSEAVVGRQDQDGQHRRNRGHAARFQVDGHAVDGDAHHAGRAARRTRDLDIARFAGSPRRQREVTGREAVIGGQFQERAHRRDRGPRTLVGGRTVRRDVHRAGQAARRTGDDHIADGLRPIRGDRNAGTEAVVGGETQRHWRGHGRIGLGYHGDVGTTVSATPTATEHHRCQHCHDHERHDVPESAHHPLPPPRTQKTRIGTGTQVTNIYT